MLKTIGISSLDELYSDIPREVLLNRPLKVDGFASEQEVRSNIEQLLKENKSGSDYNSFLGAGIYNHYIPAAVKAIVSRTEFQTAYTPYQAEISQGLLQSLFEFESMIRDLTAVDAVLRNYTEPVGIRVEAFGYDKETGGPDMDDLESKLDHETAAVYCEVPSFFGTLDADVVRVPSLCHEKGALSIIGFDPISLGGLRPPGEYGADIVVAEGQSISSEMNFGGPGLGIIGCKGENLVRQIPGRLIGMTTTIDGTDKAFSMVLQTREQHIRRERATSNICTNEALLGIGAAAYLSLLGPQGLHDLFESILVKTRYAIKRLQELPKASVPRFDAQHYQEFVVTFKRARGITSRINRKLLLAGMHGGKSLVKDFPELGESSLICVTEINTGEAIDRFSGLMTKLLRG
jgi:glycine dehydrogenase subunit 1